MIVLAGSKFTLQTYNTLNKYYHPGRNVLRFDAIQHSRSWFTDANRVLL